MINWKPILVAATLTALPLTAYGETINNIDTPSTEINLAQRWRQSERGKGQRMEQILQQLDLTTEQSQQIDTIRQQAKNNAQDLRQQLQAQREQMKALYASDADAAELRNQYQAAKSLREQLGNNRFETMLEIREVLTVEQRAKFTELSKPKDRGFS
ncbi:MAG: Spy/CpxP family protein refolding chaperone [Cyanobacteria bacterium J06621_8]